MTHNRGEIAEKFRGRYLAEMKGSCLGIRRIDDKLINLKLASRFRKAGK